MCNIRFRRTEVKSQSSNLHTVINDSIIRQVERSVRLESYLLLQTFCTHHLTKLDSCTDKYYEDAQIHSRPLRGQYSFLNLSLHFDWQCYLIACNIHINHYNQCRHPQAPSKPRTGRSLFHLFDIWLFCFVYCKCGVRAVAITSDKSITSILIYCCAALFSASIAHIYFPCNFHASTCQSSHILQSDCTTLQSLLLMPLVMHMCVINL